MKEKDEFIEYLEYEKKYSYYTFKSYSDILDRFIKYLDENKKNVLKADINDFNNYLKYIEESKMKYKANSVSKIVSTIKSFYKYLYENKKIKNNPAIFLSSPKKEKLLPKYLYDEQIEELLNIDEKEKNGLITKLIIELLYSSGMRVSELVSIKIEDINFKERQIKVTGKGSKDRIVLYGSRCAGLMDRYLKNERYKFNSKYFLVKNKGVKLRTEDVRKYINYFVSKSKIKTHVYPHMLRHTFATDMLNNGASLTTVKELLGHENLSTTSIYTHVSNERLRSVYLKTHPRANKK